MLSVIFAAALATSPEQCPTCPQSRSFTFRGSPAMSRVQYAAPMPVQYVPAAVPAAVPVAIVGVTSTRTVMTRQTTTVAEVPMNLARHRGPVRRWLFGS